MNRFSALLLGAFLLSIPGGSTAFAESALSDQRSNEISLEDRKSLLAEIFTTLTHETEWGDARLGLSRFETEIVVDVQGEGAADHINFIDEFLRKLHSNTGVDVARGSQGNIHVRFFTGSLQDIAPSASCILVSGNLTWNKFLEAPIQHNMRLASVEELTHVTIFIPARATKGLQRACIVEEIMQSLGVFNDVYWIGNTIFNDDDAHFWPTDFDYLIIRLLYAPELQSGLRRDVTERAVRAALDRISPHYIRRIKLKYRRSPLPPTQRLLWRALNRAVYSSKFTMTVRREIAEETLELAATEAPYTPYHCHSLTLLARLVGGNSPKDGLALLEEAFVICERVHGAGDPRLNQIDMHRASLLLRLGQHQQALDIVERLLASVGRNDHYSALLTIKSLALRALSRPPRWSVRFGAAS